MHQYRLFIRSLSLLLLATWGASAGAAAKSPFDDAVAVWHMGDEGDSAGKNSRLRVEGDVRLGVELTGSEREASVRRGGDGNAAEFRGGYLSAGQGADGEANLSGKAMTLAIRLRNPSGQWGPPLFSKHGGQTRLPYNLYSTGTGEGSAVGFELGTDYAQHCLRLTAPLGALGPADWHDVVVRFSGAKVELFVDGVLMDEDWPIGALRQGNAEPCLIGGESLDGKVKSGFQGLVDHAAMWNRALTDEEVFLLSGGRSEAAAREKQAFGESSGPIQYWRPAGHNTNVGDCMPFFHDGTFHLFYLFDRRHHGSKYGLGAHQWAHVSSTDLVHWKHHPLAVAITDQREGSICTGSVFFHDGTYHAYYATRAADRSGEKLSLAKSTDGIHFTKTEPNPFAWPQPGYGPRDYRDPTVFRDERTSQFHMLVAAALENPRRGCLAQLVSTDLKNWRLTDPCLVVNGPVPECPDYFAWNGWYYLMSTRYWKSRDPLGPWNEPKTGTLDVLYVPKTAAFTGGRRIYVSWLREGGWGGCTVFREVIQHADGMLGTKFVPEMIPRTGQPVQLKLQPLGEGVSGDARSLNLAAAKGENRATLDGMPANARITLSVKPKAGVSAFGLRLRASVGGNPANVLRLVPSRQQVQIVGGPSLSEVEGLDRPLKLDMIVKGNIFDVCIDNRRTMIGRVGKFAGSELVLFCEGGEATFEDIEVRPLD